MPTVAAHNNILTTDVEQVLNVRGSTGMEITISVNSCILRFAHRQGGMPTGLGVEELHGPKLLTIDSEDIDQVGIRSAAPGLAAAARARVTIIATRG